MTVDFFDHTDFYCKNGASFEMEHFCNGVADCSDGSDEIVTADACKNCTSTEIA